MMNKPVIFIKIKGLGMLLYIFSKNEMDLKKSIKQIMPARIRMLVNICR